MRGTIEERFWAKVNRDGPIPPRHPEMDNCWLWIAAGSRSKRSKRERYGSFDKKIAHRVSYEITIGPIPDGLQLNHLCEVKLCVRPSHLQLATASENTRYSWPHRVVSHCHNGHPFDQENTVYVSHPKGIRRVCKICRIEWKRKWRANRRALGLPP